jgi:hypothetical protein|tara:strand:- start:4349 stop:4582 length:234 start_codon:yes stop_codon:yes gene_type:complete
MEWLSLSNAAYLFAIIVGGLMSLAAVKYRPLLKEIKEVAEKYNEAMKDGKLSKAEQQSLAKECMDVISAVCKLVWRW